MLKEGELLEDKTEARKIRSEWLASSLLMISGIDKDILSSISNVLMQKKPIMCYEKYTKESMVTTQE